MELSFLGTKVPWYESSSYLPANATHACSTGSSSSMSLLSADKPSAPRGPLEVSDITRSSLTLSWLAPLSDGGAAVVAYVVERREHLSPTWTRVARVKPQTTVYTVNNLAERTDYQFRVYAENVEGAGPPLTLDVPVSPRRAAGQFS